MPWVYALEVVAVYDQRIASAGRVVSFSWRAETYRAVPRHKTPETSKSVTIGYFRCLRTPYQRKQDAAQRQQRHGGPHGVESATEQQPRKDTCIPLHTLSTLFTEMLSCSQLSPFMRAGQSQHGHVAEPYSKMPLTVWRRLRYGDAVRWALQGPLPAQIVPSRCMSALLNKYGPTTANTQGGLIQESAYSSGTKRFRRDTRAAETTGEPCEKVPSAEKFDTIAPRCHI